ncbi:MAG: Acetate-CoA ligase [Candidatus Gottesmanbacteria bacterium GW2011_GWA2_44_17]|uniref:acetate--CoA ligase n=1 Tax=Candidatus Gottesmanbacteria bacterium GW2011_GWA2_44_17 TaxID=1618444 RepID=A0A0G1JVP7_9BACT|nr:MAG: Acetate-CoA ligase [Candidatus Gottesmanbacteria bacterium GW2011_GWA2_44_17]
MLINPKLETLNKSFVKDYEKLYQESIKNPEAFWENIAKELSWFKPWDKVLDWKYPYARWFVGGQTNIVYNALDRHLETSTADKTALIWIGQDMSERKFTYRQLSEKVCKFANGLKSLGVKKGDKITIYLPRIPEQFIAMLACLKIGAVHSVVYSGFSASALKNRIEDAEAKIVICANSYPYGKKIIESKKNVDEAIKDNKTVKYVIVVKRLEEAKTPVLSNRLGPLWGEAAKNMVSSDQKYIWWNELMKNQSSVCPTEIMESSDPAFILYTSGTTGKPKGIIHAHGGYMVGIYATLKFVFDISPDDIFWSTADAGWITGHSYILYSPLINGITTFVYEGTPDYPDIEIWWRLIDKYKVTKFYTAPTAIRALMRFGEEWWQTETGMFMITPIPSVSLKPGSAFKPFFGIEADVVDDKGNKVPTNTQGYLIIKKPWPSMFLDVYNNPTRYKETYFEKIPNVYFAGDSAKIDEDEYYWIVGRNDDVIKVSGHRLGSAELESAFVSNPKVAEAAVIGKPHEIKGESIKAFVILKQGVIPSDELKTELVQTVRKSIGPIATPDEIDFVDKLPKTRSGKIMRRVLKAQELGLPVGDVSTLES